MTAPTRAIDFDHAYRSSFTLWGDVRIPSQLKTLVKTVSPVSSLELGCGLGRFSSFMAQSGVRAVAVDFSSVAIERAKARAADADARPTFYVADVTRLSSVEGLGGPFDVSFDVGCFHCLGPDAQRAYVAELRRVLKPGATHLIWAMDRAPSDEALSPEAIARVFEPTFKLRSSEKNRRRMVASHWYWLQNQSSVASSS
jgi:cyclopropane fatty-acyl-phospholipid synthase-like methyltransferase